MKLAGVLGTNLSAKEGLLERLQQTEAVIGVVGLGYVGLPFAVEKAKVGFQVIGLDRNSNRVEQVNRGENYIGDVDDLELKDLAAAGQLRASTDFDELARVDVVVICVPTPLTKNLTPDLQYVEAVTREVAKRLRPGQLISLESTTYPGTTEEVMLPILEGSGLKVDQDFFLAHSPERVDPGNQRYSTKNTNKVVGGVGPNSLEAAMAMYGRTIDHVVPVSSAKAAELVKVYENTFRAVNIALVNELAVLCDRMDLNVWEVLDAAFTKPFGIMPFYPGPGVGGHCIPIDPHYLEWKAKELEFNTRFIALAGEVNRKMPRFVRHKAERMLNDAGIAMSRSTIVMLGIAYKKDIDDWRESPALEVLRLLEEYGATVHVCDPHVMEFSYHDKSYSAVGLSESLLQSADLVLITTEHSAFDFDWIVKHSKRVLDTRNATKALTDNRDRVVLL